MTNSSQASPDFELRPQWSVSGGELLKATLAERGLRQSDLAERTGLTAKHINQIIKRGIAISGDTAFALEQALGVPANFWTRADAMHAAHLGRERAEAKMSDWIPWAKKFDLEALLRHSVIGKTDDNVDLVKKVLELFRVSSPEALEETYVNPRVSFRRNQQFRISNENTALWLRLVERTSEQRDLPPFRPSKLRSILPDLRHLTTLDVVEGLEEARRLLAGAGVDLVFLRNLTATRISGATWWIGERPIIGITDYRKSIDGAWFNVFHEIGHILLHPRRHVFLDSIGDKKVDGAEAQADDFACESMLTKAGVKFIQDIHTSQELQLLAARTGVGADVVAGQYMYLHGFNEQKILHRLRKWFTDDQIDELESHLVA